MPRQRTTLLLDPALIREVQTLTGASTITETVELSLRETLKARRRQELRARLGTFDLDLSLAQLRQSRSHG